MAAAAASAPRRAHAGVGLSASVVELVGTIVGLILIASTLLALTNRVRFPFTVALLLAGIGLAQLAEHGPAWLLPLGSHSVEPTVILFVFLPTLVFESAFNLDVSQLRRNLLPVLVLAGPGLLLSTFLIGGLVALTTPIAFAPALLLGSILSATDAVAMVSLFKRIGAPKRLIMLVEGESLFNDATSIVAARILSAAAIAGVFTASAAFEGAVDFCVVFAGGIVVGWVLAVLVGFAVGRVESNPHVEMSLTIVLAYASFLVAELVFHVSGVMATAAAGITMGGWGRPKISPSVGERIEHLWDYLAFAANALIFLLIGLRVDLGEVRASAGLLPWVLLAVLAARAATVNGLVPLIGFLPRAHRVDARYRTVIAWGGLPGSIALAIVLTLPASPQKETFVALVMGVVLFALLAQGLTMERLVHALGLDKPVLADRLARAQAEVAAARTAIRRLPELQAGGIFSSRIATRLRRRYEEEITGGLAQLATLRKEELDPGHERRLLFLRCYARERTLYQELHAKRHLSEGAFRDLAADVDVRIDAMRHQGRLPASPSIAASNRTQRTLVALAERLHLLTVAEHARKALVVRESEHAWGRYQATRDVLAHLDEFARHESAPASIVIEARVSYTAWRDEARTAIDHVTEQFPEFAAQAQERLAERLLFQAEKDAMEDEARAGAVPQGVAQSMLTEMSMNIRVRRGPPVAGLRLDPAELLRTVPFFRDIAPDDFARVARQLRQVTVPAGAAIIERGEQGDSLFLIARGVVRVVASHGGVETDVATLMAGEFFGEKSLLHRTPRTATCRAVTPCALYELRRDDFVSVAKACPGMQRALELADAQREPPA